jgi:hypothetical protein
MFNNCRIHLLTWFAEFFGSTTQIAFSCDLCSNLVNRKSSMIKLFLSVASAITLMGLVAYGQTSSSSTTVATGTDGTTQTTSTTTESTGTVTEFAPGETMVLKTEAAEPVRYKFSKQVTYVTSNGRVIDASKIRKDSKVQVHYVKDGDDMLVDKVIVTKDRN